MIDIDKYRKTSSHLLSNIANLSETYPIQKKRVINNFVELLERYRRISEPRTTPITINGIVFGQE